MKDGWLKMSSKTIVMYEISQKQQFIFRTNRLIENIGASHIIRELTTNPRKLFENEAVQKYLNKSIDLPDPQYRIVGGGNAIFIFNSENDATTFSRNLSFYILQCFPGIELFLVKRTFDWEQDLLYRNENHPGLMEKLQNELANKKNERRYAVKQESWGIQQACVTSGMPANTTIFNHETNEYEPRAEEFKPIQEIGREIRNDGYHQRFIVENDLLPASDKYKFLTQDDIENVFSKQSSLAEKNYLAIISIDGNAMGVKVSKFFEQKFASNEDYLKKYEAFTNEIDEAYTNAFRKTIAYVMERYDVWATDFYGHENEQLENWKHLIPIRPIIASGDDVSLITYGKLGIEMAKTFLTFLQEQKITIGKGENARTYRYEACAGVAIIRHKYPFWLGFQLADELCNNAKKRLKKDEQKWKERGMTSNGQPYDTSLIDWHLVPHSDMVQNIESYRKQYYENDDDSILTMRPYYIQHVADEKKHFASYDRTFKQVAMKALQRTKANDEKIKNENHIPSMAKWKNLRDVYHEGIRAVEQWLILNQFSPSGEIESKDLLFYKYRDGFGLLKERQDEDGQAFAAYYDAIEIFDFFTDLSGRDRK